MSMEQIDLLLGEGGAHVNDQARKILKELQGRTVTVVAGAGIGTKMDVAALRLEDTLLTAVVSPNSPGSLSDDVLNMSIVDTHASGALVFAVNPTEGSTFTVNANVYTFKAAPSSVPAVGSEFVNRDVQIRASLTASLQSAADVINAWEVRKNGQWTSAGAVAVPPSHAEGFFGFVQTTGPEPVIQDGDTVTLGADTYTFKDVAATSTQVPLAGSIPQVLAALAAKINAHSTTITAGPVYRVVEPQLTAVFDADSDKVAYAINLTAVAVGTTGNATAMSNSFFDDQSVFDSQFQGGFTGGAGTSGHLEITAGVDGAAGNSVTLVGFGAATAGSQVVNVGGAKTGASATGLTNDTTAYTASITVDGVLKAISVVGSAAQTYTTLMSEINTDLGASAVAAVVGGNIKVTSATTGATSTVSIVDSGANHLFASLTSFVAILTATPGADADITASGATLSGGSDTGGVTSETDLSNTTVEIHWLNKQ